MLEFFKFFFLFSDPHFRRKKKCSDSPENSTNRPDDIKSGPNLASDHFFDFLKNSVPGAQGGSCLRSCPLPLTCLRFQPTSGLGDTSAVNSAVQHAGLLDAKEQNRTKLNRIE